MMAIRGVNSPVADSEAPAHGRLIAPNFAALFPRAEPANARLLKLGFFAVWLLLVVLLDVQHAFWRDEVRALSLALAGSNIIEMFHAIQGEGHPAVWYLLLRATHAITGSALSLPIVFGQRCRRHDAVAGAARAVRLVGRRLTAVR